MNKFYVDPIGNISVNGKGMFVKLEEKYIPALKALDGFGYIDVIWWFEDNDNIEARNILTVVKPYQKAPDEMGVFATRSPIRPNPIALSVAQIISIDYEKGIIRIAYIDANDNTPVLDIKPYTPSIDRVENPAVPKWCAHWPKSYEESGNFDWESEFLF
ncbi:MAG: SAM-dependent methyltransferase [Eubacteriaceae bacterium]|nr:SAM-dependent methyltransferase [Eubacteriaceae bacterium]